MLSSERGIPLVDLSRQYDEVQEELEAKVLEVLRSGRYILGPEVEAFEREMAEYLDVPHAVGVGNGTDALYLLFRALGIGPGDEVITTAYTFIATADTIAACGATPVFADIDPLTYNLNPASVLDRITFRTRAVVVVHLFGLPAEMDALLQITRSHDLMLIEDCAQAHGAVYKGEKIGSFGIGSTFSFFPTKPLGCAGDGGMICAGDEGLAERLRMLRAHGMRKKYYSDEIGVNSRLDAVQAAILRVKLGKLDDWNAERRRTASLYREMLHGVDKPFVPEGLEHVYHQYTIASERRDEIQQRLADRGIGCNVYFPQPLHLQRCFTDLCYGTGDLPASEEASRRCLSLPIFNGMTEEEVRRVSEAVNEVGAGPLG